MGLGAVLGAILNKSGLLDNGIATLAEVAGVGRCWFSFGSGGWLVGESLLILLLLVVW